jgi:uncharacterized membrane protein YjfL (UPF0719 family)
LSLQILFEGQTLNDSVLAITSSTTVLLVITDIWCPILFFVVYDLLNLYKKEVEVRHSQNSPSLSLTCLSLSLSVSLSLCLCLCLSVSLLSEVL